MDITKDGLKTKALILQAMGYPQKDIAEFFNVSRDGVLPKT
jgi:hypothetical protein